MTRFFAAAAAAGVLAVCLASPSQAQTVRDKATCTQAVADARTSAADAQVNDKTRGEINDMIRIAEHLCGEANFVYAETLLSIARGMGAQE